MPMWRKVQGDVGITIDVGLTEVDTLDDAILVVGHITQGAVVVDLTAGVLAPDPVFDEHGHVVTPPSIRVELSPWLETANPGEWKLEYEVTFGTGNVETWPEPEPDLIVVRAQGA